ncbi:hypothetical protein CDL15_Pgr027933 [Punica granatum]|uniref:Protein kinase domain-containing protein n=1 Tax=Punica granatum TaxID=22663 RepID=A0A218XKB0_PUNGR|nr:hypothetical protein CDL15_Pgr027933 [Punica granatum]
METPSSPSYVIIAFDATKVRNEHELWVTLNNVQARGDILRGGDTIVVLGVLHKVSMEVKVIAGAPVKQVILQEAFTCKATWVVLDRHLRKDFKFYLKQIPCKVALIQDSLSVDILRSTRTTEANLIEHRRFYSVSKPILSLAMQGGENKEQSAITSPENFRKLQRNSIVSDLGDFQISEKAGVSTKDEGKSVPHIHKRNTFRLSSLEAPILCATCGTRTELDLKDSMRFSFSEVQQATNNFSKENLLGEGGYGYVYKGNLKDGQSIAAKVRKEASAQGFEEFRSEIYVLSFARHKNIVMLLGYCCKENLNVLVYEYICNKSLDWHLFDENAAVLEWHRRYSIAIGTAKGLRFLHEECRGGPIIHRDMRPSNILVTHDFVPMLGDFGLARWKTSDDPVQTRILGTLGYLAPEYAENGTVSIRTDVYAFGIILLQLISGRKVVDRKKNEQDQSLRQWAEHLIENMELHELIDPRMGDSYDTYELYLMSRAAYSCVKSNPELRPSMGEEERETCTDKSRRCSRSCGAHRDIR